MNHSFVFTLFSLNRYDKHSINMKLGGHRGLGVGDTHEHRYLNIK